MAHSSDVSAIRRAYVAKLRSLDIEADPAAFMALRQAFEQAVEMAKQPVPEIAPQPEFILEDDYEDEDYDDDALEDEAAVTIQRTPAEWLQNQRSQDDWRDFLGMMINAHGVWVTWQLFNRALARGDIALTDQTALAQFMMSKALKDETLSQSGFMTMVKTLGLEDERWCFDGWQDLGADIKKRIDAYHWLDALKATANRRLRGPDRYSILASRLFLQPGTRLVRSPAMLATIEKILGDYQSHADCLRNDFDSAWPRQLETKLQHIKKAQARNRKILLYGVLGFFGLDILYIALQNLLTFLN